MVTRWAHNPEISGSIPEAATTKNGYSNLKNLFEKQKTTCHSET
jgi:hypothetical protein